MDRRDNKGMCPLFWAVHRAHIDTAKLLLGAKAYPNNIGSLKLEESEEVTLNKYDKVSDVVESRVRFASKILTPHRMH